MRDTEIFNLREMISARGEELANLLALVWSMHGTVRFSHDGIAVSLHRRQANCIFPIVKIVN